MKRAIFIRWVLDQLGCLALWGAKGDSAQLPTGIYVPAYDCSGLVTCGYRHAGCEDWTHTANTDVLWTRLEPTLEPQPGDLAFYGGKAANDVEHVAIVLAGGHVICASGATSLITTAAEAWKDKTRRVKVFGSHLYRKSFRGFRRSTPLDTEVPNV